MITEAENGHIVDLRDDDREPPTAASYFRAIRRCPLRGEPLGVVSIRGIQQELALAEAEVLHDAMGQMVAALKKAAQSGPVPDLTP